MTDHQAGRRAALVLVALAVPFAVIALLVAQRWHPLMSNDADVVRSWREAVTGTRWEDFFHAVGRSTQGLVTTTLLLGLAALYALRRLFRIACWILVVLVVESPGWGILKQLFHRHRPDIPDQIGGYSFPSGHSTSIAAVMGVLIILTARAGRKSWLPTLLIATCVAVAALVGVSRIFIGAHYPSDVVGGWLLGTFVAYGTATAFGLVGRGSAPLPEPPLAPLPDNPRTLAVILNPVKVVDAESFKYRAQIAARAAGWEDPLWFETTVDDAGGSMARAAIATGADVIAVAGGDGTVRVVCSEMARRGIPVGVIPVGTGNLLARNLGIPLNHDAALDAVLNGRDRAIDMVRVEGDGLAATRFAVMAGLGLDAAIMEGAPPALKARIGWPAYVVAGARQLRFPAFRVDIAMDGKEPVRRRARTVLIGNVGSLQAGIPLLPDALIDDGVLDVVVIAPRRIFGWLPLAFRVITKRRGTDEHLDRYTGRSVVVTVASATQRQLDGDTVGVGTTLSAQVEPGVLLVRVPR